MNSYNFKHFKQHLKNKILSCSYCIVFCVEIAAGRIFFVEDHYQYQDH